MAPRRKAGRPPALVADGVRKDYGDVLAVGPIDLTVRQGQSVVLVGHNGSGKTTFLLVATGMLEATEGSVTVCGAESGSPAARAALSFLPDTPVLYDDLSVMEHAEYTAGLHGVVEWESRARDLAERLGLDHRIDDLPSRFSRGLRQKTSLLLGLLRPFSVLCVDEPFVGLDAAGKEAVMELFDEAQAEGATVIVATHELAFVERVQRCVALRDGEIIHDGPAEDVDVLSLVS